jgi:spermidine synthase
LTCYTYRVDAQPSGEQPLGEQSSGLAISGTLTTRPRAIGLLPAACVATFLGASLGFAVQPLVSRQVLPRLGGGAAVWNTTLVFFQAMLLLGYLLTHLTTTRLSPRHQIAVHLGLVVAALATLPVSIPDSWSPPTDSNPSWWLLATLTRAVGLPYLAVATTSPLIQRWYAAGKQDTSDPYFLYAISNIGSFAGLLGVPLLFDRYLELDEQARWWALGFAAFGLVCAAVVLVAKPHRRSVASEPTMSWPTVSEDTPGLPVEPSTQSSRFLVAWWVLLAFVPSSLILGVTSHLTTDVASVPLLWVIPLGLYLLTHVIAFSRRTVPLVVWDCAAAASVGLALASIVSEPFEFPTKLLPHLASLLFVGLSCHGRLAATRPAASRLTSFYLALSVGGVLGGVFNALVAPLMFKRVFEYPAVLVIALLVIGFATFNNQQAREQGGPLRSTNKIQFVVMACVATASLFAIPLVREQSERPLRLALISAAILTVAVVWRAGLIAAGVATAIAVAGVLSSGAAAIKHERSFYGAISVEEDKTFRTLVHGTTTHGYQFMDLAKQNIPTSYYGETGPLGLLIKTLRADGSIGRIGAVGLGVGTIASHLGPNDQLTYYEIDPLIVRLAQDPKLFTYLADTQGKVEIKLGDGRRSLQLSDQTYDLIVLDAFSSDSIPVHLITQEAFEIYRKRLAPGGVLAVHVSNRYLDLEPVVAQIADNLAMADVAGHHSATDQEEEAGTTSSDWIMLAEDPATLGPLTDGVWGPTRTEPNIDAWTDSRADLLSVIY